MLAEITAATDLWSSIVHALPVVLGLVLIEGLLSVDNALAIAAMAAHLDEKSRTKAMNIGYLGAYGFRLVALLFASWIISNHWIMLVGALYLVWLMCAHFVEQDDAAEAKGKSKEVLQRTFAGTIAMISLMDLSLSVDNVVAAIALSPKDLWPVYVGVTIGIVILRLVASLAVKMIEKYPVLEHTAFVLVGYVGILLLIELRFPAFFDEMGPATVKLIKFAGIVIILTLAIAWSKQEKLQKAMHPVLHVFLWPMRGFAAVVNALIWVVTWPFKALAGARRGA